LHSSSCFSETKPKSMVVSDPAATVTACEVRVSSVPSESTLSSPAFIHVVIVQASGPPRAKFDSATRTR
jgi:hypothetical protein